MGRDNWRFQEQQRARDKRKQLNPIWRAVGCVVILALAGGGYLFAEWFLNQNAARNWIPLPEEFIRLDFAPWLPNGFLIKIIFAIIFMVIAYGILSVAYALLFPVAPGEYDHPPLKPRPRRRP
jgi:hypothetical protein